MKEEKKDEDDSLDWIKDTVYYKYATYLKRFYYNCGDPIFHQDLNNSKMCPCQKEFRCLLDVFNKRRYAVKKCHRKIDTVKEGDIQPVNITELIIHYQTLHRQQQYQKKNNNTIVYDNETREYTEFDNTPATFEEIHKEVTHLRQLIFKSDPTWRMITKKFNPYVPNDQSLDWFKKTHSFHI